MKRHLIAAAVLGLAACAPALALDFVANDTAQSVVGAPHPGESSLQTILTGLFPASGLDVDTDQSSAAFWSSATPSATSSIPYLVAEFAAKAPSQSFGIWFGTDTANIVTYNLLLGAADEDDAVGMTIVGNTLDVFGPSSACGTKFNCGTFTHALINPTNFGFFFKPSPNEPTYYSLDQLNPGDRKDRFIAFQDGSTTNWMFAYEDGTDWDYNDMAVKVESITAVTAVPEPETYALMVAGLAAVGFMSRRRKSGSRQ
jgi:Domain of unknown function (DUF4114)/PEP-CTERM motif